MTATLLLAALLLADEPRTPPAGAADRATATDRAAGNPSLDGDWMVVCLEKNGQPVAEAKNCTVSVKGNVATFKKADGAAGGDQMRAMRFDFGRNGTLYATEANADGRFSQTSADRTDGDKPAAGARTDDTKFSAGGRADGAKAGVYVLTQDFLAVCLHDEGTKASPGTQPPAAGDRPTPGSSPLAANDRPAGGQSPQAKSYCTVILKRSGTGQQNQDRNNQQDRNK